MKNIHYQVLAIGAIFLLGACSKKDSTNPNPPSKDSKIILNTNTGELNKRINTDSAGVLSLQPPSRSHARDGVKDSTAYPYPLELIAEVTPPEYKGQTLRATHVAIDGNYAYVSYNVEGEKYLGGIDVFDITSAASPKLVAEAIFPSTDISSIAFDKNRLYVAGASDVDQNTDLKSPGIWGYVDLKNNIPSEDFKFFSVSGKVGTDIAVSNGKVYVTSGATGSFDVYNESDQKKLESIDTKDLRSVAVNTGKVAVLSGVTGVDVYDINNYKSISNFSFGQDIPASKRTMDFNGDNLIIAAGKKGIEYYNAKDGSQINNIPLPSSIDGVDPENIVTNAVSNNNGLILSANGAAGIYVCNVDKDKLALVGALDLKGSSNYVKSKGDYIFVATGKGGLQILKLTRPDGTFSSCESYPAYNGNAYLNVNSGDDMKYRGSAALKSVNVNAKLTFCGSMSIYDGLNINSGGTFNMNGALSFGQNKNNTIYINSNATLFVQGTLTIYGNLTLNGGTLKLADGAVVTVYGKVTKNSGSKIEGDNFTDTFGNVK